MAVDDMTHSIYLMKTQGFEIIEFDNVSSSMIIVFYLSINDDSEKVVVLDRSLLLAASMETNNYPVHWN